MAFVKRAAFLAALPLLAMAAAHTCDVPVYRWAIERWAPDAYEAAVFHRGPLSDAANTQVDTLKSEAERNGANLTVRMVDVDEPMDAVLRRLWEGVREAELPCLALRYPRQAPGQPPAWTAPLNPENCGFLMDSPARKAAVERLIEGDSGVWLFLESGNAAEDMAAATRLNALLAVMNEKLKLSTDTTETVPQVETSRIDELRVAFPMVRVSRKDPAEAALVSMLLGTEPGLYDLSEPMAFPVFGRGRALYALVGKGINQDTVEEACRFLIGSCSCQVKDENPGVDLLMSAKWEDQLDSLLVEETLIEVLPSPADMQAAAGSAAQPEAVAEPAETPEAEAEPAQVQETTAPSTPPATEDGGSVLVYLLGVLMAVFLLIAAATVIISLRGRKGN